MQPSYLLTVLTFLPLAGTVALWMLRADDHECIRRIALAISEAHSAASTAETVPASASELVKAMAQPCTEARAPAEWFRRRNIR